MKKDFLPGMVAGLVLGVVISGSTVLATGILKTDVALKIDGAAMELPGLLYEDRTYVRLVDLGEQIGYVGWWTREAGINFDSTEYYEQNSKDIHNPPPAIPSPAPASGVTYTMGQTAADGSGSISDTRLTSKVLDGVDVSREDFSQSANPAVLNERFTRGMYNAAFQTILDRDEIVAGNSEQIISKSGLAWFNPYYSYASAYDPLYGGYHTLDAVLLDISWVYGYRTGNENYLKNVWEYPEHFTVQVCKPTYTLDDATVQAIKTAKTMEPREAVLYFNRFMQPRLTYNATSASGINQIFGNAETVKGACGTYAYALQFLCESIGIPTVTVSGSNHAWIQVYVDGQWWDCDPTNSRYTDTGMFVKNYRYKPDDSQRAVFAKELLIPGSTK